MDNVSKNCLLIFLIVLLLCWVFYPMSENFDPTGSEVAQLGCVRYGLRGDRIRWRPQTDYFIRPDRRIRLSASGGEMYESNHSPMKEGVSGCKQVSCPLVNGYDSTDKCWQCGSAQPDKMIIPDITPHVAN